MKSADVEKDAGIAVLLDRSQVRQIVKRDTSDLTRLSPAQAKAFGDAVMADFTITIQLKASKDTCGGSTPNPLRLSRFGCVCPQLN
ncbi:hypothetical protein CC205_27770, partial [Pseudomonas savastanoi pv. nerii]